MKSIPIDCHSLSGIGRLCSRPAGLLFASLVVTHIPHVFQYDSMSCDRWPPEISPDILGCFKLSKMANYIMCMIDEYLNQLLSFMDSFWRYANHIS